MTQDRHAFITTHAPLLLQQLFRNEGGIASIDLPKKVSQCVTAAGLLYDAISAENEK